MRRKKEVRCASEAGVPRSERPRSGLEACKRPAGAVGTPHLGSQRDEFNNAHETFRVFFRRKSMSMNCPNVIVLVK